MSQTPVEVNGLSVVGVPPLLGRTYRLDDFTDVVKEKEARAIVSHDMWQSHFNGAADVIGRMIRVDAEPRIVIGVVPPGFALTPGLDHIAFWAANDLRKCASIRCVAFQG